MTETKRHRFVNKIRINIDNLSDFRAAISAGLVGLEEIVNRGDGNYNDILEELTNGLERLNLEIRDFCVSKNLINNMLGHLQDIDAAAEYVEELWRKFADIFDRFGDEGVDRYNKVYNVLKANDVAIEFLLGCVVSRNGCDVIRL